MVVLVVIVLVDDCGRGWLMIVEFLLSPSLLLLLLLGLRMLLLMLFFLMLILVLLLLSMIVFPLPSTVATAPTASQQ